MGWGTVLRAASVGGLAAFAVLGGFCKLKNSYKTM